MNSGNEPSAMIGNSVTKSRSSAFFDKLIFSLNIDDCFSRIDRDQGLLSRQKTPVGNKLGFLRRAIEEDWQIEVLFAGSLKPTASLPMKTQDKDTPGISTFRFSKMPRCRTKSFDSVGRVNNRVRIFIDLITNSSGSRIVERNEFGLGERARYGGYLSYFAFVVRQYYC